MNHLIIGNGIAGITAATTIRQNDPDGKITVFTDEFHPFGLYARKDLAQTLAIGIGDPDDFLIHSAKDLQGMGIELVYQSVEKVAPKVKQLVFKQGVRYAYDRLLIASGATPKVLNAVGNHLMGVHQLRDFDDTGLIEAWLPDLQEHGLVVIGGGILGLDLCYSLRKRDIPVTLIVRDAHVGLPHLSVEAGRFIENRLKNDGVNLVLNSTVVSFRSADDLILDAVELSNGEVISSRMAICAIGVRPTTEFLDESGIELDEESGAVIVDGCLQTNLPDIYAAGNCASADGFIAHNWKLSQEQGRIAGLNMVGQSASLEVDIIADLDTRLYDLPFAFVRKSGASGDDVWRLEEDNWFAEVILSGGRIGAATLFGDMVSFGRAFRHRCANGQVLSRTDFDDFFGK
jgi:NAD(P)H-nitrite reductase large subunit